MRAQQRRQGLGALGRERARGDDVHAGEDCRRRTVHQPVGVMQRQVVEEGRSRPVAEHLAERPDVRERAPGAR